MPKEHPGNLILLCCVTDILFQEALDNITAEIAEHGVAMAEGGSTQLCGNILKHEKENICPAEELDILVIM